MRDSRQRLLDIPESIERIHKYGAAGREAFEQDELIQVWILHHLQILGEAVSRLEPSFRDRFPEDLPWSKIIGMRNVLVHQYFGIDTDIVWSIVERDLPQLHAQAQRVLAELDKT